MSSIVCSTTHVFHYMFDETEEMVQSMLDRGLRPLSDFPDSPRWKQIQEHAPGMFEMIYENFCQPVIRKPYINSGIFVTPIDFYKLPGMFLSDKPRVAIPAKRIMPEWAAITYELEGKRESLPFSLEMREKVAQIWREELVREWFARDQTKVFYYVPQIATYQPDGIPVFEADIQRPATG